MFPTGHLGVAVDDRAHAELWPQIAAWLGIHDAPTWFKENNISELLREQ
jgi:hypothetical protein